MANANLQKVVCQLRLNNGTDSQGNVKTVGVSLGSISPEGWNADKALAIVNKLEDCLTKTVYETYEIKTSTLRSN